MGYIIICDNCGKALETKQSPARSYRIEQRSLTLAVGIYINNAAYYDDKTGAEKPGLRPPAPEFCDDCFKVLTVRALETGKRGPVVHRGAPNKNTPGAKTGEQYDRERRLNDAARDAGTAERLKELLLSGPRLNSDLKSALVTGGFTSVGSFKRAKQKLGVKEVNAGEDSLVSLP